MRNDAGPPGRDARASAGPESTVRESRTESDDRRAPTGTNGNKSGEKKPFITDRDPGDEEPALPANDATLKTRI